MKAIRCFMNQKTITVTKSIVVDQLFSFTQKIRPNSLQYSTISKHKVPFLNLSSEHLASGRHSASFIRTCSNRNHDAEEDLDKIRYFDGDFGQYELVLPVPCIKETVPQRRKIPSHINKPEYYKTGQPKIFNTSRAEPIASETDIQSLREACKLARFVLNSLIEKTKVGVTTDELDSIAHDLIVKRSAYPSPLNYRGFPKSICTSVNNVTCHGIPDDRVLIDGDIVNIDVTVYLNGFHGDCSETVCVGNVDDEGRQLIKVAKECLFKGIEVCQPDAPFRDIGKAIQSLALQNGYNVVPAFTGHGIGKHFHCPPDIYHMDFENTGYMKPGIAFTIEPILSQGSEVIEILDDGWTAVSIDGSRSAQFEHTILITNSGAEILT